MSIVETVRGPVDASELGTTLPHEHILIVEPEALANWGHAYGPCYWDEEVRVADANRAADRDPQPGIRTIIDTRPRRDSDAISRESSASTRPSTSNIVVAAASTRSWRCRTSSSYRDVDAIAELFVRENPRGHQTTRA